MQQKGRPRGRSFGLHKSGRENIKAGTKSAFRHGYEKHFWHGSVLDGGIE